MRYKAILWDLDGTLLDTLQDLTDAVNVTLTTHGFPTHSREAVCGFVGNGIRSLIERALPPQSSPQTVETVLRDYNAYYAAHCNEATAPYAGILPLLQRLDAAGVRSAVVSNKSAYAVEPLVAQHFGQSIALAVGVTAELPPKPDIAMVNNALVQLGVAAADALYIGDSEVDVHTARHAGMDGVFVSWGFRSKEQLRAAGAQVIYDTVADLEAALWE